MTLASASMHRSFRRRSLLSLALCVLAAVCFAGRARAQETRAVDLQLVLAVDASGSVDASRFELQKRGYADAFADPQVISAIRGGSLQAIAVTMLQWTGPELQNVVVDWTLINDEASAKRFSQAIAAAPRSLFGGGTSISGAIDVGARLFEHSGFRSARRVIDVSGDGANNRGRPAADARDAAVRSGIVINGLPILALEPDLDTYYRNNVIGGPGAFVIAVKNYDNFATAILQKLVQEISSAPPLRGG
ncbi:MAG TPA: DUF1194 domain-containing protein [Stellaceae bacterium]|nr:DUF1194 domain-containing protein [Stellaceae bacterium]